MDNFIKVPSVLVTSEDLREAELSNNEAKSFEGFAIINIGEIAYICGNDKSSSVYFKSGDYIEVNLELDEIGMLIGCK